MTRLRQTFVVLLSALFDLHAGADIACCLTGAAAIALTAGYRGKA